MSVRPLGAPLCCQKSDVLAVHVGSYLAASVCMHGSSCRQESGGFRQCAQQFMSVEI